MNDIANDVISCMKVQLSVGDAVTQITILKGLQKIMKRPDFPFETLEKFMLETLLHSTITQLQSSESTLSNEACASHETLKLSMNCLASLLPDEWITFCQFRNLIFCIDKLRFDPIKCFGTI